MKHAINQRVVVGNPTDETMLPEYMGIQGTVVGYNANEQTGNTEEDPLHYVILDETPPGLKGIDTFWYEELQPI